MKIVTWNVNSVRARLGHVLKWLDTMRPDVVLLQEIKCINENFPHTAFEDLGYQTAVYGQKTYNGVAILSRIGLEDTQKGNPYFEDVEARIIEAVVGGTTRVINIYAPNGQEVGCDKYAYKLAFYEALISYLKERLCFDEALVIGGDFNIAPKDKDVYEPIAFEDGILCSRKERMAFRALLNLGLEDALRYTQPDNNNLFTWWDYRQGAFAKNHGLRIDHFLLSSKALQRLDKCFVDLAVRAQDKPSDHAPVWACFKN